MLLSRILDLICKTFIRLNARIIFGTAIANTKSHRPIKLALCRARILHKALFLLKKRKQVFWIHFIARCDAPNNFCRLFFYTININDLNTTECTSLVEEASYGS